MMYTVAGNLDRERMRRRLADAQRSIVESGKAAGSAALAGDSNGVLVESFVGMADVEAGRKIGRDTLYHMYSMTKPVTVVAAMQLIERGAMRLDDALSDYLPEFGRMTVWSQGLESPARNAIRVGHLFTMTSGLSYLAEDLVGKEGFFERWRQSLSAGRPWGTVGFAREFAGLPLNFEPGTRFMYGLSHDVLGALVELISGQTLEAYCRENIFEPLGMSDTCWMQSLPEHRKSRLAGCYARLDGKWVRQPLLGRPLPVCPDLFDPLMYSGGAGLIGSAGDYAKLLCALTGGGCLNGTRILSEASVQAMAKPQLDGDVRATYNAFGPDQASFGPGLTYGLGFRVLAEPPLGDPGKPGEWGWSGALGTWFFIDPADGLWLLYLHQHIPAAHESFVPALRAAFYGGIAGLD